ncbi:MAG: inositol monophosphatase [Hyphomicrobiaceae bacterium]
MTRIDIQAIADLIRRVAEEEVLPRWRNLADGDVTQKDAAGDIVTVADRAAERALSAALVASYPTTRAIGEETVAERPDLLSLLGSSETVWVIDPIDGTRAFASGSAQFDVMLALVRGPEILAGWIFAPVAGAMHMAERGAGAWRQDAGSPLVRLAPELPRDPASLHGVYGRKRLSPEARKALEQRGKAFASLRPAISAGQDYARLVSGHRHFALFQQTYPWDHLPGLGIAQEVGFVHAKHDGTPYLPGDSDGGLLIAPDRDTWRLLKERLLD